MKLAVIGPSLEFSKGSYILRSLGRCLESNRIQVFDLGYNDIVLNTTALYYYNKELYSRLQPILYKNSFRRGIRLLRLLIEKNHFVKYVMKNFDIILTSVTALELPGIIELTKRKFPIIFWDIDSPNISYSRYSSLIDSEKQLVLCYSKGGVKIWSEHGIESQLLPLACDTRLFYPRERCLKKIDILFTGRFLRDRIKGYKRYLYPLVEHFRSRVTIVGQGWAGNKYVCRATILYGVPYYILNKLYNMTKININIHRDGSRSCHSALNLRCFEVTGAGQLLLCDNVKGIEEFFENRREIIVSEGGREMIEYAEYFLYNEEERNEVAKAAYERVLKEHTIEHRALTLKKFLENKYSYLL